MLGSEKSIPLLLLDRVLGLVLVVLRLALRVLGLILRLKRRIGDRLREGRGSSRFFSIGVKGLDKPLVWL